MPQSVTNTGNDVVTYNLQDAAATTLSSLDYKVVYLVRHAEGFHNIGAEMQLDAHLTPRGWAQVAALRNHLASLTQPINPEVIIVSPLTRTLETAVGVFGGDTPPPPSAPLLMAPQSAIPGERSEHPGIAAGPFKVVAYQGCRERISSNLCDRRRDLVETRQRFPGVDFSLIDETDTQYDEIHGLPCGEGVYPSGECQTSVTKRGLDFFRWLADRPEQRIAVVSHCDFLYNMLRGWGSSSGAAWEQQAVLKRMFENAELRSLTLGPGLKGEMVVQDHWFAGGRTGL